jgi:2-keto-3-deoxy-L-rhamnonate aldolase RhmA
MVQQGPTGAMTMVKVIETIFLGPADICCNALGVGQENNRDLVRMLINSFIWMAVGSIYMAIIV